MRAFLDDDFMLYSDTARHLYHTYAVEPPILDYHCHLTAREIYENKPATSITRLWLDGDHYKWRAMRGNGIPERRITGDADDYDRFLAYAETLPQLIGNPLYHWSHLELQRYFGIRETLSPETAADIYRRANEALADGTHTPQTLIRNSNVFAICTTDDPADDLRYHALLAAQPDFATKVLPAWRPDAMLSMELPGWRAYMDRLAGAAGLPITGLAELKEALLRRMDAFQAQGCVASDHGMEAIRFEKADDAQADAILRAALADPASMTPWQIDAFKTTMLLWLATEYHRRNWAMELHIGAMRSCNRRMVAQVGEATGFDSICDHPSALALARFMDTLDFNRQLPKTILFCLNETENSVYASMLGNFQGEDIPSKIQFGTAWWFQDHVAGMEKQMRDLAALGVFGRFIGMLTDSRSLLSYPRHEYFRRILCNLLGAWVEAGQYPNDEQALAVMVRGICFDNARRYFGL